MRFHNGYMGLSYVQITSQEVLTYGFSPYMMMFLGFEKEHTRFDRDKFINLDIHRVLNPVLRNRLKPVNISYKLQVLINKINICIVSCRRESLRAGLLVSQIHR